MAVKDPKKRLAFEIDTSDIQKAVLSLRALGDALENSSRRKKKTNSSGKLAKFRANASRMMFQLFYNFTLDVYETAVSFTPKGDASRIASDPNYGKIYKIRQRDHGIPQKVGYHKGAWMFSLQKNAPFTPQIVDAKQAKNNFKAQLQGFYESFKKANMKTTVYVSTIGPAYGLINAGIIKNAYKTDEGITKPTLDLIMQYYK